MEIWELLLLAVGLSMDAFAVAVCKGLATKEKFLKTGLVCGLYFGLFQGLMPFIGWFLGDLASKISFVEIFVNDFSPYIAFILLAFLGGKMIFETIKEIKEAKNGIVEEDSDDSSLAFKVMLVFAIATSIDALAAGLTFTALDFSLLSTDIKTNVIFAVVIIGIMTFIFSFVGSILGAKVGSKFKEKASIAGGIILIGIGLKILIEYFISLF